MAEARLRQSRSALYLESTNAEQLGLLPGEARTVGSVMSLAVTVTSPRTTLREASTLMTTLDVPAIVVYDGKRLIGMITDRDLGVSPRAREVPEDGPIAGLMRTEASFCFEDDLVADAVSFMRASQLDWLPVVDRRDRLVGILSAHVTPA